MTSEENKPAPQTDEEIEKLRRPALVFAEECASVFGLYATAEVITRLLAAVDQLTAERDEERRKRCTMTERVMALAKELELTQDKKFELTKALDDEKASRQIDRDLLRLAHDGWHRALVRQDDIAERMRKLAQKECEEQAAREHEAAVTARASHLLMSGDAKQKEYARNVLLGLALRIAELPLEAEPRLPESP